MQLIDSHSHIDFTEFDSDRNAVIARAVKAGISNIIISSTISERWIDIKKVVLENPAVCHPAYGLHPMFMQDHQPSHLDNLQKWLEANKAVAVGEIGLDFFIEKHDKESQIALFISQLEIAAQFKLPVIIHARKSLDIILKHLRLFPNLRGSIHSFSGSEQQAKQLIDLGFYLGFGGPVTYTRAARLRKLLTILPLEALLLETDSPDQPDADHHGKRNEPAYLLNLAKEIAELRGIELVELAEATSNSAKKLFKL